MTLGEFKKLTAGLPDDAELLASYQLSDDILKYFAKVKAIEKDSPDYSDEEIDLSKPYVAVSIGIVNIDAYLE